MRARPIASLFAAVLILAAALAPVRAAEESSVPGFIESLPPEIATVRTAGWWSAADRSGTIRIVITEHGFDQIVSRLYLQWLEVDEAGARVIATLDFDELNEVPVRQLDLAAIRTSATGIEVELTASSLYTDDIEAYLLRAGAPGEATLSRLP